MAFSTNNCIITFRKKKETESARREFQSEITGYDEDTLGRTVSYTRTIGGIIVPSRENAISKKIKFDFVVENFEIIKLMSDAINNEVNNFDFDFTDINNDYWKITIEYSSDIDVHNIVFYNCLIESFTYFKEDDVLKCSIEFSFPLKNFTGYSNYYILNHSNLIEKDTLMGYEN